MCCIQYTKQGPPEGGPVKLAVGEVLEREQPRGRLDGERAHPVVVAQLQKTLAAKGEGGRGAPLAVGYRKMSGPRGADPTFMAHSMWACHPWYVYMQV